MSDQRPRPLSEPDLDTLRTLDAYAALFAELRRRGNPDVPAQRTPETRGGGA